MNLCSDTEADLPIDEQASIGESRKTKKKKNDSKHSSSTSDKEVRTFNKRDMYYVIVCQLDNNKCFYNVCQFNEIILLF